MIEDRTARELTGGLFRLAEAIAGHTKSADRRSSVEAKLRAENARLRRKVNRLLRKAKGT